MLFLRGTFSELVLEAQLECSLTDPCEMAFGIPRNS